jgi:alpha-galactosidase
MSDNNKIRYRIIWDQIGILPAVQLKFGIKRRLIPMRMHFTKNRDTLHYDNEFIELRGKWDNSPEFGSLLSLKLKNISENSIRLTRLVFPAENGLDKFLKGFSPSNISFLRNGYQSWSTARSYRLKDKPLRPWLQLVSLASSNLANLPSNTAGNLSSEMYSIISNLGNRQSFLVGQTDPFNQFFYIRLKFYRKDSKLNYLELVYDFGRKMIMPGETIHLDGIIMAQEETSYLLTRYFNYIKEKIKYVEKKNNIKGWSTWYYYYTKISPEIIYKNVRIIKEKKIDLKYIQIDDGYQKNVGDWLQLKPQFEGKMKLIASHIKELGFEPGLWIAPFICENKSEICRLHPEYILRNEYGRPILCGYNPVWKGRFYYGLDITNPRFEEYLRRVIHTIVHEWGFSFLKLDFLFAACLRGGTHHDLRLSRSEILKKGLSIIREEAGQNVILDGCGMPITCGIGMVDSARIGPDTAPYWKRLSDFFFNSGSMLGVRNSTRNILVRSCMNNNIWINNPDCLMLRKKKTSLSANERMIQINSIILSGGTLFFSDNLSELSDESLDQMGKIIYLSDQCFKGKTIALDLMQQFMPEIIYNTAGYLGIFNFKNITISKRIDINYYTSLLSKVNKLQDVWTSEKIILDHGVINLSKMSPHSSRLFKIVD